MIDSGNEPQSSEQVASAARELLGYLNFSSGARDAQAFRHWNTLFAAFPENPIPQVRQVLAEQLQQMRDSQQAFRESGQAEAVLNLVFDELLPAYWEYHRDLLFHLQPEILHQPFFIGCLAEAVLQQGDPWTEADRIIPAAIDQLNDFLGYRPVAVLENGRMVEPYPHERFRPIPIHLQDVGTAVGPYHDLIARTLAFLEQLPSEVIAATHFHLANVQELAVDIRSYDYNHPVFKRTNYLFGEWDPHQIGLDGHYHRFVVRQIILDALLDWIQSQVQLEKVPYDEALYDASAALSGTILMASSISGSGPDTFDSTISLSSLLPIVARQRDFFYERLMSNLEGARAERLRKHQEATQQPFGHVRHALNMFLSSHGASQVRNRELALMYARMGFPEEARRQAAIIPAASIRFETEIQWRLRIGHQALLTGDFARTEQLLEEIEDLERRAIECGALVDPWNILGFQGQFTLFANREDTVPDVRVESLIELKDRIFNLYATTLREAALAGEQETLERVAAKFQRQAEQWDQYATTTVDEIPKLFGEQNFESSLVVARTLAAWKREGASENSISFWNQHLDLFDSQIAYHNIVHVLLEKRDLNASLGLLMQWLNQTEESENVQFDESFSSALLEWTRLLQSEATEPEDLLQRYRRMLELLEANAGGRWGVPPLTMNAEVDGPTDAEDEDWWDEPALEGPWDDDDDFEDEEDDDFDTNGPFAAAYEGVTFRDSADDGQEGALSDASNPWADNEFEQLNRSYEPQLKFLQTLADIQQQAIIVAARILHHPAEASEDEEKQEEAGEAPQPVEKTAATEAVTAAVENWSRELLRFERELGHLLHEIHLRELAPPSGSHDANVEYDIQLQSKLYLMHNIIWTLTRLRFVRRVADSLLFPRKQNNTQQEDWLTEFLYAILRNDVTTVRKLLPNCLQRLSKRKLLYVPLESGGTPRSISDAQELHTLLRFLVTALPGLGLYRETWHVIVTAYRMERGSRPRGPAITEFDRLFRLALSNTLSYLLKSSLQWRSGRIDDDDLIDILAEVVDHFGNIWLKHSQTMRLSAAEGLKDERIWDGTKAFIRRYGAELFHARNLTLGYIRAIVQSGVEEFLEYLEENDDPVAPHPLIEDLRTGTISADDAATHLEIIYGILIDKFDRFLEYNSTTTHSDYGDRFDCLLDFLRLEADYDRDDWNYAPLKIAHEALIQNGRFEAAKTWEQVFAMRSADRADEHLKQMHRLEKKYGVKLPALSDQIGERFVKPLAINRMVALVKQIMTESEETEERRQMFDDLRVQIENYQDGTHGTGLEVPEWLQMLEQEVRQFEFPEQTMHDPYGKELITPVTVNLREMRRQLRVWDDPVLPTKRSANKRPRDKS
ncbi:hypothetical protein [Rubinisphaera brasiliensis]|uniref:Uncharacterized protein n=1 Tax=Rubinisphaera brasiliensis (strain ATCC 49424 / DSM 5305 / JCM 21570 / IAM 15109 / NBRC 103401 / IFAM 1448) TaxID=756272 RepID=F0SM55_RUBBR|nr:hypothetical protein [Rubinisphaera brasiliensis]ADY61010.1 hypothetical protein Plabr_3413 [Rubinisphaera brasiliensis DSM 5305]